MRRLICEEPGRLRLDDFLKVRNALEEGDFPTAEYITKEITPEEVPTVMSEWKSAREETLKVIVRW